MSDLPSKQSPWRTAVTTNFSGVVIGEAAKPGPVVAHSLDDPEAFGDFEDEWASNRMEGVTPNVEPRPAIDNMVLHPAMERASTGRSSEDQQALLAFVVERRQEALARRQALHVADGAPGIGAAEPNEATAKTFWPCRKWNGSHPGQAFKLGDCGLGYYCDKGGCTLRLATALQPPRVVAPVRLPLDELVKTTIGIFNPTAMAGPRVDGCSGVPAPPLHSSKWEWSGCKVE